MVSTGNPIQWKFLGEVDPQFNHQFNQWMQLGVNHQQSSGIYRLTFYSDNIAKVTSFAWLRMVYLNLDLIEQSVSQSIRIYPKPEKLKIEFKIPKEFAANQINLVNFQVKKIWKRQRSTDFIWSVGLEELQLTEALDSDNAFFLVLENVSYARDPQYPDFYISTFTERVRDKGKDIRNYEVGRFYTAETDEIFSDPQVIRNPYELVCIFTQRRPIQPGELKVRVIY